MPRGPGIVVSDAPLATQAGVDVLEAGGNAVDAAVATAFALAVVYPRAGNLGGGGFLVARIDQQDFALDFRETAPAAATRDMFEDAALDAALDASVGALSSGVPGSVAGLFDVHRRFGRLPWSEVVAPAERLARDGFVIDDNFHDALVQEAAALRRSPASEQLFMPGGQPLATGAHWSNPDLAATLRRIAQQGPAGFYAGETAAAIAAEMQRGGGLITAEDLAAYRARPRPPLVFEYRGRRVLTTPPPSGGVVLAMLCELLEPQPQPLASLGWHSPAHLHLLAEALRRAFAARNVYLGDPDFTDVPVAMLLSEEWAAPQRASISVTQATPSSEIVPGPDVPAGGIGAGAGGQGHTTHLSVLDAEGNAVALTSTLNFDFGSGVTVAGAGFLLNNEMDDFASRPGQPNGFGLVQGEANAIAPGKRMLSSMCPIIVTDADGRILLVAGAAGGPKIITSVFQVLSNVIDFGQDVQAAVAAPRLHHQHQPDRLLLERAGFDAATIEALRALGHRVEHEDALADVIAIGWRGDALVGAPDPRRGGAAGSTK